MLTPFLLSSDANKPLIQFENSPIESYASALTAAKCSLP